MTDITGSADDGTVPDFGSLFPLCSCGQPGCDRCSGWQLTPRTAMALWDRLESLAEFGYDDVAAHGDGPVSAETAWQLFDRYPRLTWRQDAVWRRQCARSCDDLAADLAAGRWPLPRCTAEEVVLHLALEDAEALGEWGAPGTDPPLPEHEDDLDYDTALDALFQDHDVLALFQARLDGIEDPSNDVNRELGMGDHRPAAWFEPFNGATPRDGRRPFRR